MGVIGTIAPGSSPDPRYRRNSLGCTVEIDHPRDVVYDAWTQKSSIPTFMGGRGSSRPSDPSTVDWVAIVEGRSQDYVAEVVEQVEGSHIAWDHPDRAHAGVVSFEPVTEARSSITVSLEWEASAGDLGDQLIVRRQLQDDLDRFRRDIAPLHAPLARPRTLSGRTTQPLTGADTGRRSATLDQPRSGPGRHADSPAEIPARGWTEIAKRTAKQVKADNVSIVAGGVAFYVFVALVPTLVAVISLYGLVADPVDVGRQLGPFLAALPPDAAALIGNQIEAITGQKRSSLGIGLVVGVVVALLGASKGMLALVAALNIAYDEEENRPFIRLRGLALLLTVALSASAIAGVGGMVVIGKLADTLGNAGEIAVGVLRWPVLAALAVFALAALYRWAPDRAAPTWRWVTPGAFVATLLWLVGSIAFSVYVKNFGSYNETYGTLGAVVVLLLWLLLTAYAIVLGAELDREVERQTGR